MEDPKKPVGFLTALLSIMAAAIGIQKRKNMERDLSASNPIVFIFAAILFLALFIGSIVFVVSWVTPS